MSTPLKAHNLLGREGHVCGVVSLQWEDKLAKVLQGPLNVSIAAMLDVASEALPSAFADDTPAGDNNGIRTSEPTR